MKRLTKTYSDGTFGPADDLGYDENSHPYTYKSALINALGHYEETEQSGVSNQSKVTMDSMICGYRVSDLIADTSLLVLVILYLAMLLLLFNTMV